MNGFDRGANDFLISDKDIKKQEPFWIPVFLEKYKVYLTFTLKVPFAATPTLKVTFWLLLIEPVPSNLSCIA